MNVCTVSYSAAWWSWERWEREIDWMALHGFNLPLTFTGQEAVWRQLWHEQGLTDAEIEQWLAGPAFLAWQRMGNLRGWAGPLTDAWQRGQLKLGKQIAARQMELGMVNVLPGFAGHVPGGLKRVFPKANITQSPNWWGAPSQYCCDYLLEPSDPLYGRIGKRFYELITQEFGETTVFNSDIFNEMVPYSNNSAYLAASSGAVYKALNLFNPKAVWLMQGWLFVNNPKFWTQPAIEAYLSGVPNHGMLILDLFSDLEPVWSKTKSYYGKAFIWCMLHNFGGNRDLYGNLPGIASSPIKSRHTPGSTMVGTGLTMEAIEQNPVVYELMTDMGWFETSPPVELWLQDYQKQRYGKAASSDTQQAWQLLLDGVYKSDYMTDSAITHTPSLKMPTRSQALANFTTTINAWRHMYRAALNSQPNGPMYYDLCDLLRQVLVNHFEDVRRLQAMAYNAWVPSMPTSGEESLQLVRAYSEAAANLIIDLDNLLGTNINYLLGQWLADAQSWAQTPFERDLNQFNALNQLTLWGPNGEINDYAAKEWSGLVKSYYLERWVMFSAELEVAIATGQTFDQGAFDAALLKRDISWQYAQNSTTWPSQPVGNQMLISGLLHDKYVDVDISNYAINQGMTVDPADYLFPEPVYTRDPWSIAFLCDITELCGGFTTDGYLTRQDATGVKQNGVDFLTKINN
mmetsp:Transcript_14706/g.25215  ORF Transcript_14706/g.25215 Transcript_14706/m.25215 type:complete len:686 (+) Transcript_14706:2-2059(+)